jgi:hypothetical protein
MSLTATILALVPAIAAKVAPSVHERVLEALATRVAGLEVQLCDALNRRDSAEAALERLMTQVHFAQGQQEALAGNNVACQQAMNVQAACHGVGQGYFGAQQNGLNEAWCNCVPSRASLLVRGR